MAGTEFAVELVDLDAIIPNPENPNQGDVGAIATAIATDGWHGAVLCQAPTARRKRPKIYAGEHRWRALKGLVDFGIEVDGEHLTYEEIAARVTLPPKGKVPIQALPLSDLQATRKMIADNRASALATQDEAELADLLKRLDEEDKLLGSLYDQDDLDDILRSVDRAYGSGNIANTKTPAERLDSYLDSAIRSLILPFPTSVYDQVVTNLDRLGRARDLDSHSEIIAAVLDDAVAALAQA